MRTASSLFMAATWCAILVSSGRAETRAVIVGIDAYTHVKPLQGAVADALDIAGALRERGLPDRSLKVLTDAAATRDNVLRAIDEALAALSTGDLFILAFAGHGASEQWGKVRPPGVAEGEARTSFILGSAIIPNAIGEVDRLLKGSARERIVSTELNTRLAEFERKKIRVVWVADTCHGGGLTRQVTLTPGMSQPSYRAISPYRFKDGEDPLEGVYRSLPKPVNPEEDLSRLTFLAAVDKKARAPEVPIPAGSNSLRGALSYSFSRMIDGTAKVGDGKTLTRGQIFSYLKPSIRQLADNKQIPDLKPLSDFEQVVIDLEKDFTRGGNQGSAGIHPPAKPASATQQIVTFHGLDETALPGARPNLLIKRAASASEADLVIDRQRVLRRNGDILAAAFAPTDIVGMAEREVALRRLQAVATSRPKDIQMADGDRHYRSRERVSFVTGAEQGASNTSSEYYFFFNVTYNGIVQYLGPTLRNGAIESATLSTSQPLLSFCVTKPFGADLAVLVTSNTPLDKSVRFAASIDAQPKALELVEHIETIAATSIKVGLQGFYTLPEDAREKAHPRCP